MNSVIIAIAGGTGSGKTYLTKHIAKKYSKKLLLIIDQDSYYNDISNMDFEIRCKQNFDHPNAIDIKLLNSHLEKLLNGKKVKIPCYDFKKHLRIKTKKIVEQHPIIIVEGILMLHYINLHKFYSLKVFVDTPENIRLTRRIDRDKRYRGRTEKSIQLQYYKTVKPMHDNFVYPSKNYADIIINGSDKINDSVKIIKQHIDLLSA